MYLKDFSRDMEVREKTDMYLKDFSRYVSQRKIQTVSKRFLLSFSRSVVGNIADFFGVSILNVKPVIVDWYKRYDLYTSPHETV